MTSIDRLLKQGVSEVIVEEDLRRILEEGKQQLRVKYGVDPSRPDIHLGHFVCFRKLRQFQDLGHRVILIIGDWTAQIGDPSGKSATRTMLTREEVLFNAQTYMDQFFKVVDLSKTDVLWQSEWFGKFGLAEVIQLTSRYTVAQMLAREDFSKRFSAGSPIAVTELLYPLLQAYDSIAVHSDVEMGGTDQKFNLLVGREMQREFGQRPQNILTVPILTGLDGVQKMSKSLGNYIGVTDAPSEMFGKVMSMPDRLIPEYFELVTDVPLNEIDQLVADMDNGQANPRDLKMRLGREIVTEFHGAQAAAEAEDEFKKVFQRHEVPTEMPDVEVSDHEGILDLLLHSGLAASRGQAKRLVQQGGVRLDGNKLEDTEAIVSVNTPIILQVGKRNFVRLIPAK
jgi:tyrosyl-tRNA synthetase